MAANNGNVRSKTIQLNMSAQMRLSKCAIMIIITLSARALREFIILLKKVKLIYILAKFGVNLSISFEVIVQNVI